MSKGGYKLFDPGVHSTLRFRGWFL